MADADFNKKSPAEWLNFSPKDNLENWAVNDENGDAIDMPDYESAVKVAAAFKAARQYISLENYDIASVKAQQLDALIAAIVGEGFEHFKNLNDDVQHWYLMAISEHSMDIKRAISGEAGNEVTK